MGDIGRELPPDLQPAKISVRWEKSFAGRICFDCFRGQDYGPCAEGVQRWKAIGGKWEHPAEKQGPRV